MCLSRDMFGFAERVMGVGDLCHIAFERSKNISHPNEMSIYRIIPKE